MKVKVWLAAIVVVALTACNGRHETPTSTYGQGILSGEVVMAGVVGGSSPAGVEVGVRGTGMTMLLGEDGQFAFAGVPDGAELDFRRASDGIEASLRVDQSAGFITVELAKASANATKTKSSKRRGAGATREVYEFEGEIRTASAGSIVLFTSKKVEQTIAIAADTVIRKGNQTLTPADLIAGMRVHVKARKSGETFTAAVIIVQRDSADEDDGEDTAPPAVREHEGTVRSVSPAALVIFTSKKVEVTFTLTADTVIRKGNTPVAVADLQPGWRVHVKATANADGTATATRVTVQSTKVK